MFLVSIFELKEWLGIIVSFLMVLTVALKFASVAFKNVKLARWAKVGEEIKGLVQTAEDYINFDGEDKKEWVLTKAQAYCLQYKIPFDVDLASELIEGYVELSRQVNRRA
ncbi:MAG: hypothetical protein PF487_05785 [Bacteroidales bacterium]|jgi:hypothetical protein|nr:hypothetical protein [Bacteroidales bacterium]